jgi:Uma2 family endonuclease
MFERYTEKARRVVFFARYEASHFGSPYIDTEHVLLGLLREDKALTSRFLRSGSSVEEIRRQIEGHTPPGEKVSTSVDLPLSNECKRVLAYAAEEAERLNHRHIGTEHLLLGLLREEKCFAAEILHECGLRLSAVREELARISNVHEVTGDQQFHKTPGRLGHNRIRDRIAFGLRQFLEVNGLGEVVVETEFRFSPDTVLVPDVAFVTAEHIKQVDPDQPLAVPPALVIEVVTPNDLAADLAMKIDQYLRAGASAVWVIYPNVREAHIFHPDLSLRIVGGEELLAEEKLLPGFSLPLNALFS